MAAMGSRREGTGIDAEAGEPKKDVMARWARSVALCVVGATLVAAGVLAIFMRGSDGGGAALLGVGTVLFLLSVFWERIDTLKYGELEVVLRRRANDAARKGDIEEARVLDQAADALSGRITEAARAYKLVRSTLPAGSDRTALMEGIVGEAKRSANAPDLEPEEVLRLYWTGSEGVRVWALGVLQARPELATPRVVLDAVRRPDYMFDQFHGLVVAAKYLEQPTIRPWTRERIEDAVRRQLDSGALGTDRDCLLLANQILGHSEPGAPSAARR
jgi:hypothetical protein